MFCSILNVQICKFVFVNIRIDVVYCSDVDKAQQAFATDATGDVNSCDKNHEAKRR